MTLTVRLDPTLEGALERHCADTGSSKSDVVHESLSAYLLKGAHASLPAAGQGTPMTSAGFQAFAEAGLVGSIALAPAAGAGAPSSADKAAVRARVAARANEHRGAA